MINPLKLKVNFTLFRGFSIIKFFGKGSVMNKRRATLEAEVIRVPELNHRQFEIGFQGIGMMIRILRS